jgi:hypothetical protein
MSYHYSYDFGDSGSDYDYDSDGHSDGEGYAETNPVDFVCPYISKIPGCNLIFLVAGAILIIASVK